MWLYDTCLHPSFPILKNRSMKSTFATTMLAAALALTACNTNKAGSALDGAESGEYYLVVGSYSGPDDEGIRVYSFDETSAEATYVGGLRGIENPSFVFPSADGLHLYAVGENFEAKKGSANSLAFDKTTGRLTLLNTQLTHGDAPCNIIVSPDGKWVYTSNYNGGSITEFPLDAEGRLGEGRAIAFSGSSVDSTRQTQPHLHAVNFTPDGRFLLANDLGTDKVHAFPAATPLDTTQLIDYKVPAGMGPRHLCFAPDGKRAYLLGEISGDVVTFAYDQKDGAESTLTLLDRQTVRADSLGAEGSADIHISADGRFLYTSHRLKGDGVSIFSVNPSDGTLAKVGYQPTGIHPRNFSLSPDGKWLLVACRDDNVVQIFARDAETGLLKDTGKKIEMPKPVCLQWIAR